MKKPMMPLIFLLTNIAALHGGSATVTQEAALKGSYGARFGFTDTTPVWIEDGSPTQEARYRTQFFLRTDALSLPSGDRITLLRAMGADQQACFALELVSRDGLIYLDLIAYDGNGSVRSLLPEQRTAVLDGYHSIELDWSAGSGNGFCALWLDGAGRPGIDSLDNGGLRVELVRLGSIEPVSAGTFGHLDIDDFTATRGGQIGPLCTAQEQLDQAFTSWSNGLTVLDLSRMLNSLCNTPTH
jgi:hypothetical protein